MELKGRKLSGHELLPDLDAGLSHKLLKARLVASYHLEHLSVVGIGLAPHQFLEVTLEEIVVVVLLGLEVL